MSFIRSCRIAAGLLLAAAALPLATQAAPPPQSVGTWQAITPGPLTVDGRSYTPSCSGFPGTSPTFKFWARTGTSKNTMVFFEGGGACWNDLTCSAASNQGAPQFFNPMVVPGTDPATFDGIFKAAAGNPVSDWNMVYIPYCTADIHGGSATKTYTNVAHPLLPPGFQYTIQHRGFDNFMAVLDWMKRNQGKPKNLLVTGASAGGYGATLNFPWLASAYPDSHVFVLADASQGVTTPAFDLGASGRAAWNLQFAPAFGANPTALRSADLLRTAAANLPDAKVAQFTTAFDGVQIFFYCTMTGELFATGGCQQSAPAWYAQMVGTVLGYASTLPNYRYYLAWGDYHTILRSGLFYTEATPGIAFNEWLAQMLANRGGADGAGGKWFSVACPGCLPQ
jgi:hypothetical protein